MTKRTEIGLLLVARCCTHTHTRTHARTHTHTHGKIVSQSTTSGRTRRLFSQYFKCEKLINSKNRGRLELVLRRLPKWHNFLWHAVINHLHPYNLQQLCPILLGGCCIWLASSSSQCFAVGLKQTPLFYPREISELKREVERLRRENRQQADQLSRAASNTPPRYPLDDSTFVPRSPAAYKGAKVCCIVT